MSDVEIKSDPEPLYIYSMIAFGAVAIIISGATLDGKLFDGSLSLIALLCVGMSLSPKYKNLDDLTHFTVIASSILVLSMFLASHLLLPKIKSIIKTIKTWIF